MPHRGKGGAPRRGSSGVRGKTGYGRRTPPPESTGAEAEYLLGSKEAGTPMVVQLLDGETIRGVIEYFDRHMIKISRPEGPNLFIRKDQIRYLYEEE